LDDALFGGLLGVYEDASRLPPWQDVVGRKFVSVPLRSPSVLLRASIRR